MVPTMHLDHPVDPTQEQLPAEVPLLTAQELLAGSLLTYDVEIPSIHLRPGAEGNAGRVRIRPLKVATLALISKAAREDASLVPLLMIKDALAEPALSLEQIRMMHVGLVHFLVRAIHRISGIDTQANNQSVSSPSAEAHVLLARHFGWTPAQVGELTPGQIALYLAGVERLLALESERQAPR